MAKVHPTAVVDPKAELADGVEVGPYCVIGPQVNVGAATAVLLRAAAALPPLGSSAVHA